MGRGPGSPVELNSASGSYLSHGIRGSLRAGVLVADDVGRIVGTWGDEAIIGVLSIPANVSGAGLVLLLLVVVIQLEATDKLAIDGDTRDGTVCGDGN